MSSYIVASFLVLTLTNLGLLVWCLIGVGRLRAGLAYLQVRLDDQAELQKLFNARLVVAETNLEPLSVQHTRYGWSGK